MVEAGQLRRWNREDDSDCGKIFLVIHNPSPELGTVRWDVLQDGELRNWSTDVLNRWSEVADGTGATGP
jgi:hypothetical protein